jgi:hypothetical protein
MKNMTSIFLATLNFHPHSADRRYVTMVTRYEGSGGLSNQSKAPKILLANTHPGNRDDFQYGGTQLAHEVVEMCAVL